MKPTSKRNCRAGDKASLDRASRSADARRQLPGGIISHGLLALMTLLTTSAAFAQGEPVTLPTVENAATRPETIDLRLGWVQLRRARDPAMMLVAAGAPARNLLSADELAFGYEPGIDAALSMRAGGDWSIDVRYLWINDYQASLGRPFASPVVFQTAPTSTFNSLGSGSAGFEGASSVLSTEVNVRRGFESFGLGVGFRYAQLNESLSLDFDGAGNDYRQRFSTDNDLYGIQVGADALLWSGASRRFRLDGFAKTGLYINAARSQFRDTLAGSGASSVFSSGSVIGAANLTELGLRPQVRVSQHVDLSLGYQLMWLNGVSLASQQMGAHGNLAPAGAIPTDMRWNETVFCHGSYVGLEVHW